MRPDGFGDLTEPLASEALFGQRQLAVVEERVVVLQQRGHRPFAELGVGQAPHDRLPSPERLQAPVEAGVGGAVAVAGVSGQLRGLTRVLRHPAAYRGGVDHPGVIEPGRALLGQHQNGLAQQWLGSTAPGYARHPRAPKLGSQYSSQIPGSWSVLDATGLHVHAVSRFGVTHACIDEIGKVRGAFH